jgi:hypothetical protein
VSTGRGFIHYDNYGTKVNLITDKLLFFTIVFFNKKFVFFNISFQTHSLGNT